MVSLIPQIPIYDGINNVNIESWNNLHSIISVKNGGYEDHAIMLECLFLGFGLKSYICSGICDNKGKNKEYMWIMTISSDSSITFYDAITGKKYQHDYSKTSRKSYPFRKVGCVFNDKEFFANIQPYDEIKEVRFDLYNPQLWYPLDSDHIKSLDHVNCIIIYNLAVPLGSPQLIISEEEKLIENILKDKIIKYRSDINVLLI